MASSFGFRAIRDRWQLDARSPLEWLLREPWRLVLLVAVAVALPFLLLGEISARNTRERAREAELQAASAASERLAGVIALRLGELRRQVSGAAEIVDLRLAIEAVDKPRAITILAALHKVFGSEVELLNVLDESGTGVVSTAGGSAGFDHSRSPYYQETKRTLQPTSFFLPSGPRQPIWVAAPVLHAGRFVGVVATVVTRRTVSGWLGPQIEPLEDAYVIDGQGILVARATQPSEPVRDISGEPAVGRALQAERSVGEDRDPLTGELRLLATAPVAGSDWRLMLSRPTQGSETGLQATLDQLLALRLLVVLLLLGGSFAFARVAAEVLRQRAVLSTLSAELADKAQALALASKHKSEFLANMSHELRTPLNAIIGFSDVMLEGVHGEPSPKQREYLTDIADSGKHLLALINDILDLSKVEAGRMELRPEPFELAQAVRAVHELSAPLARQKAQHFALHFEDGLGSVEHDPVRFRQVLYNLLSNAVKFTPEGGSVSTRLRRLPDDRFEVAVADTGIGIAPEDLPRIFEEFHQLDPRRQEGTGLGLALVKRFVEAMGGSVFVESEVGKGSTFRVRLPLRQPVRL